MLLQASRVTRRIRSGNDVPEVLSRKWSDLCLLGKSTGKIALWDNLGYHLEEQLQRKVWLSTGVLALPHTSSIWGTGSADPISKVK